MKILEFAFGADDDANDSLPHNLLRHSVCYPGTHDNPPIGEWVETISEKDLEFCMEYMNIKEGDDFIDAFIRTALGTVAETAVIPMQDWLGLGKYTRMNTPSTSGGNWQWRLLKGQADKKLCERMYHLTSVYGRLR